MPARREPAPRTERPPEHLERLRLTLADGAATTVYVARHPLPETRVRVVRLAHPEPLAAWCRTSRVDEALVGGFFVRPHGEPLGELRTAGILRRSVPFVAPWGAVRACLHVHRGRVVIARRDDLPADPRGDLLQAGPLLVRGGEVVVEPGADPEGFSSGAAQFDSDITDGRYPRAALARCADQLLAVACDGRSRRDVGMTLAELADALVGLGADEALNLDGGGSASLVLGGRLRNRPREQHGIALLEGRAIVSAIVFEPRTPE